jgi:HD-like signal output (HDOD) protein
MHPAKAQLLHHAMELLKLFKRSEPTPAPAQQARPVTPAAAPPSGPALRQGGVPAAPVAAPQPAWRSQPLPPELAAFRPVQAAQLDGNRKQGLIKVFQNIPRPPKLLHKLLSPDFVERASSSELADLISAEPLLAAQLLKAINSPMYGLRSPITSIDQAVSLLGLTAVRSLCMRYLLINSFKADSPQRKQILDATWQASALASEITLRLAQGLGYMDTGSLVSQVVLTFLGRLATASGMPRGLLSQVPSRGMLARTQAEQNLFGLSSAEIGRLLMQDWGLPPAVSDEAAEVDAVLFAPYAAWEPVRASRLGLCYLGARLGERLAFEPDSSLEAFDLLADPDPELYHVRAYTEHPAFAGVVTQLKNVQFIAAIQRTRDGSKM